MVDIKSAEKVVKTLDFQDSSSSNFVQKGFPFNCILEMLTSKLI